MPPSRRQVSAALPFAALDGFAETFKGKDRFLPGLLNTAEQEAA
jgi:hypothetical protein